jgi:uncharacterized protein YbcI
LESLVQDITGIKPRSLHHDVSTRTGEEVVVFTLAEAPQFRTQCFDVPNARPQTRTA